MTLQYTPFELPLLAAASVSGVIAWYVWRRRRAPGTAPLAILMAATAWWSFFYAVQLANATLQAQHIWDSIAYVGVLVVAPAWFAFALEYSGRGHWLIPPVRAALAVVPAALLAVVWTNGSSGPFLTRVWLEHGPGYVVFAGTPGPMFWVVVGYGYLVIIAGTLLLSPLFAGIVHPNSFYRGQAFFLLVAVVLPWVSNLVFISGRGPFYGVDPTPIAFTISGSALAWSLLRYKLLDVVPVARAAVVDSMSEMVVVLDEQGRVLDLNAAARDALGIRDRAALGKPLGAVLPEGEKLLARCTGVLSERVELALGNGAARRTFEARITPLRHRSGHLTGHLLVLDDVTARVQAEEALRASEERLRQIFESAPIGVALLDAAGRMVQVNRALGEMLGYDPRELEGVCLADLAHPEDAGKDAGLAARALAGELPGYTVEQRYVKRGRDLLWAELTVAPMHEADGTPYLLAMVENIFERKRAELLEDEQRHVAYELHDGLAQVAAGAHLHLQAFAGHYRPRAPQAQAELDRALELAQRTAREARHVIAGLRPTVVEELGLATALHMQVESLRKDGWTVEFEETLEGERFSAAVETALFRVALEALTNARKHAGVPRARVALVRDAACVRLEVRDYGRGFDPAAPRAVLGGDGIGHIGLREMEDRIALLGGTFTLESQPGAGTRIVAEVPLPAARVVAGGGPRLEAARERERERERTAAIIALVPALRQAVRAQAQPYAPREGDGADDGESGTDGQDGDYD